jgi:hypothetical protein
MYPTMPTLGTPHILTLATMLAGGTLSSLKGVTFLQDNTLSSVVRSQVLF